MSHKEKTAARCGASREDFDEVGAQKIAKPQVMTHWNKAVFRNHLSLVFFVPGGVA